MEQVGTVHENDERRRLGACLGHIVDLQAAALVRGGLHPGSGVGQDVVEHPGGDAHGALIVDEVDEHDQTFEQFGVKVFVDPKSLVYLDEMEMDYVKNGLNEGFEFNNPNKKGECGCGESFIV